MGVMLAQTAIDVDVAAVVFRDDLYPRIEKSPVTVQKYAEDLDVLPPIEINQNNELIDGWHRWTAHKKAEAFSIRATVTQTESDAHLLELAIERNASHGLQLSQDDKRDMARRIYGMTPEREREGKKAHLAHILSVSERTVRDWLSRIDRDSKAARDKRIFAMWMACHIQEEIAEREGLTKETVSEIVSQKTADLPESDKAAASHATDFEPPIYNIWKQQDKTSGSEHPGNTEVRWLDNLLYLYTKPFDIVVDPFAGGGSTIDICRKRFRRFWASDRKPVPERQHEIRIHDLTDGLPSLPRWKDVSLVYLDPPYWAQTKGKYSDDPSDLANMPLEQFNDALAGIIKGFAKKLSAGHIALVISPTQWAAPDRTFTDHIADMLCRVKLPVDMRFSVPYESQQYNGNQVDWAKQNKRCLVLTREIIVWKIA
jgi:DNA modification methylase